MKFGHLEGTQEEITGFFQDNGLNAKDYFQLPEAPIRKMWFLPPVICVIATIAALTLVSQLTAGQQTFIFLVGCAGLVWLTALVQLRFKHGLATGIVALGGFLLMVVAIGDMTPTQILNEVKSLLKK